MEKQYILFIILKDIKIYKNVKKRLIELDYKRFTVIDTIGATCMLENMNFSNMFSNTMAENDGKSYSKTLFLVLESDEEVEKILDEVQDVIDLDPKKPGKGIMFTVPIMKSHGVRFENC